MKKNFNYSYAADHDFNEEIIVSDEEAEAMFSTEKNAGERGYEYRQKNKEKDKKKKGGKISPRKARVQDVLDEMDWRLYVG